MENRKLKYLQQEELIENKLVSASEPWKDPRLQGAW